MSKQPDMTAIERLLTEEIDAEELARVVDEVAFDYADKLITGANELVPGVEDSVNFYYMHRLRDAIWKAAHPDRLKAGS